MFMPLAVNSCYSKPALQNKLNLQSHNIAFADFYSINIPIMANFNLLNIFTETWSWEKCRQLAFAWFSTKLLSSFKIQLNLVN